MIPNLKEELTRCPEKKYGIADYQYFKNGKTQPCRPNIFRQDTHNLFLVVYRISTPLYKIY